jgi:hypothetical protein
MYHLVLPSTGYALPELLYKHAAAEAERINALLSCIGVRTYTVHQSRATAACC